ncbi:hypothetical protein JXL21_07285 [Candidatus Bathyarchaeota archaeon]|nr:hypothetical protein [Candidatus Bathyarchaeota archaeon]
MTEIAGVLKSGLKKPLAFAVLIASLAASLGVHGLLTSSKTLDNSGSIKVVDVGVYSDQGCTQQVSSLDWGTPEPGDTVTKTVYVKNEGNAEMGLSMSVYGWAPPEAAGYLTVSWSREGYALSMGEAVEAVITLDVSSGITGIEDFSFQIVIEGTG